MCARRRQAKRNSGRGGCGDSGGGNGDGGCDSGEGGGCPPRWCGRLPPPPPPQWGAPKPVFPLVVAVRAVMVALRAMAYAHGAALRAAAIDGWMRVAETPQNPSGGGMGMAIRYPVPIASATSMMPVHGATLQVSGDDGRLRREALVGTAATSLKRRAAIARGHRAAAVPRPCPPARVIDAHEGPVCWVVPVRGGNGWEGAGDRGPRPPGLDRWGRRGGVAVRVAPGLALSNANAGYCYGWWRGVAGGRTSWRPPRQRRPRRQQQRRR